MMQTQSSTQATPPTINHTQPQLTHPPSQPSDHSNTTINQHPHTHGLIQQKQPNADDTFQNSLIKLLNADLDKKLSVYNSSSTCNSEKTSFRSTRPPSKFSHRVKHKTSFDPQVLWEGEADYGEPILNLKQFRNSVAQIILEPQ